MAVDGLSRLRDSVLEVVSAAANAPVVVALTALGGGVVIGRGLLGLAFRLLPSRAVPTPRHHAARIRERAMAAEQAARASGLLTRHGR
jgi:hypothetical protein